MSPGVAVVGYYVGTVEGLYYVCALTGKERRWFPLYAASREAAREQGRFLYPAADSIGVLTFREYKGDVR